MPDAAPTSPATLPSLPATKPWWRSRTLWFNGLCAGLVAAEASLGLLKDRLPVDVYGVVAFVLVVGNTVLRSLTSTSLAVGRTSTTEGAADGSAGAPSAE